MRYNGAPVVGIERDELGRETKRQHANRLTTETYHDPQGRLNAQRIGRQRDNAGFKAISARRYRYGDSGLITDIQDALRGSIHYEYDRLDRLTRVSGPDPEALIHDPAGNLLASHDGVDTPTERGSASGNRLHRFGGNSYHYDTAGNRIEQKSGAEETHYRYDAKHQLSSVTRTTAEGQTTTRYQYDPLGRRIHKHTTNPNGDSKTTAFLWLDDTLLSERSEQAGSAPKTRTYLFEPSSFKPVALTENGALYHYHLDHLGTPQEITDAHGKIVWAVRYRAYGSLAKALRYEIDNPLRFQGQYFDEETGLHYNRFRYYDPGCGRFINQDPIGLLGGENCYAYAPNPISWIDPLGLTCKEQSVWNKFQQAFKGFFRSSSDAAASYKRMKEVEATSKPGRPSPETYLPKSYIEAHIAKFNNEGAAFIAIESWMRNPKYQTLPPRKFVGLRSEMDAIIEAYEKSGGDWRILVEGLALGKVDLSGESILYIRIEAGDTRFTYDVPDGNEAGAYPNEWVPGGKTKGGATEAALVGSETITHKNSLDELAKLFKDTKKLQ